MKNTMKLAAVVLLFTVGCSRQKPDNFTATTPPPQTHTLPPPLAEGAECLPEALIQEITSQVKIQTSDLATFDRCKPGSRTYMMFEALILIKTMQYGESVQGAPFNQNILAGDFWEYFRTRANLVKEEAKCKPSVLAFVYGMFNDGVIHVCPEFFNPLFLKYERVQAMLHEVRHFEGYGHVTCSRGNRKGQSGACDNSIEEKGSYAVTVEVLTKIALIAKDIPRVQRTLLKTMALTYANEVFNTTVYDHALEAFYLAGKDETAYIYSNKGLVSVTPIQDAQIISRSATLAVFPNDKSDAYTVNVFSDQMDPAPAQGSFSADYNSKPIAQRQSAVDILNLGYLTTSITAHQVKGQLSSDSADAMIDLPWTAKAAYSGLEVGMPDEDSIYVLNDESNLFRLKLLGNQKYELTGVPNVVGTMNALTVYNGKRLALDANGQVLTQENGAWVQFAPLRTGAYSQMTRPFMWDQYFEDVETTGLQAPTKSLN